MAIAIARRKIHLAVNTSGVAAQSLFDRTQALHELLPVHGAQETKARNTMADGNLVGSLVLTLDVNELLDRQPLFNQPLFEPTSSEMQYRALSRQTLAKFRHK